MRLTDIPLSRIDEFHRIYEDMTDEDIEKAINKLLNMKVKQAE
jgi:hypothetical protein